MELHDKGNAVHPNSGYAVPGYPAAQAPQGYPSYAPGAFQGQAVYNYQDSRAVPFGSSVAIEQSGGGNGWMQVPPVSFACPPGLEYLTQLDQILVHQQVELIEAFTGFETNNKYEIKNSLGQRVYFAAEENDCCTRNFCGPARPFVMTIIDNLGHEVIRLHRPLRCSSCCCPCCLQVLEVESPPGTTVGYVIQNWHPCLPKFTIQNERKEGVLKLEGPCIPCSCCADVNFEVKSLDETQSVGRISKQWSGFVKEAFTDADNFGIQFPIDLDVKIKAVLLGACFLIDFMFFEHKDND